MRLLAKRCLQFPVFIAITLASVLAATPDYSKEAVVIQEFTRDISFADDGTCLTEQTTVLRIQSEASVRQYGVLTFRYSRDNESVDILYVRVRKPDGTVVPTPTDNVQDVSSEITRVAPTYSDLREKQIPVKALGVGDTLEYKVRFAQTKPNVPGQFWYTQDFLRGVVVLQETLRIRWPVAKYVKVASPMVKPDVREEAGQKIYCWKTAQLEPTSAEKDKKEPESSQSSVSLTTFKSWEEIGRWYGKLQADQLAITPAMQSKAAELTKGLASNVEKQRAIYAYVSTKFRYISISFGIGRYQPHAAAAVFDNQYGDCKDKHTLFAALLKAAGIDAYPVLIGAGIKLDPGVPSPAQFNHVITVIPNGKDYVWLDTTPEVAPYGLLQGTLRGEKALVIPSAGPAILMETPADPPFPSSDAIDVQATLASDGTLKAHFDMTARGDTELVLRAVFHQIASAQWQDIVQNMVHSLGFQGTVSNVDVDNPENLEKPFHCSYDYTRANYSDWSNHRVWPPLFGIPLPFSEEGAEKPSEATFVNAPGEIRYAATLHLPKDFSAELPTSTTAHSGFATYTSRYSVKDGVLSASRQLLVGKSKVPLSDWDEYRKFAKQMSDDQNQWIQLAASNGLPKADDAQAEALVRQARNSFGQGDLNGGRYALQQAETLNPKQRGLWSSYAGLYMMTRQPDKALEAASKEVQYHPDNPDGYRALGFVQADTGHKSEAINTFQSLLKLAPDDITGLTQLAELLRPSKRYAEILELTRKALEKAPDNTTVHLLLAEALLREGHKEEGVTEAEKLAKTSLDGMVLNDIAWHLADTGTDLPFAQDCATKAVSIVENETSQVSLSTLTNQDLRRVYDLSAAWDTLGWAYFRSGDLNNAKTYIDASWRLDQRGDVADHLGQIYERQGDTAAAMHTWRLALAANSKLDETRERLRKAEKTEAPEPSKQAAGRRVPAPQTPVEELNKLRTVPIPELPKQEATAEFFLLFSPGKLEDIQFISGSEKLKSAIPVLMKTHFDAPFPDKGPEKIARRGILSCSTYTSPSCQLVFLLPSNTTK